MADLPRKLLSCLSMSITFAWAIISGIACGQQYTETGNFWEGKRRWVVADRLEPIFPKDLRPGDTIMFTAPAKHLDKKQMLRAKRRLEERGLRVKVPETLFRKKGFLAGSDAERAAELMAAFADPEVHAIFPGTGGYGSTRILDKLDYDLIRRNPKIIIGFSDITALHIAIHQRTGLVTFHTPNPETAFGKERPLSDFAARSFWRTMLAGKHADPLAETQRAGYAIETKLPDDGKTSRPAIPEGDVPPELVTMASGVARGRLIGGNLSVLHALMGTPYEIQTEGKILFLEDVGEAPYRIDRMLSTLRLAGKLDHVAGVVLGQFTARRDEAAWGDDASVDDVLRDYFEGLRVPVLAHFPVGHVRCNATLPIGAMAELDATNQTLRLLESPVVQ